MGVSGSNQGIGLQHAKDDPVLLNYRSAAGLFRPAISAGSDLVFFSNKSSVSEE